MSAPNVQKAQGEKDVGVLVALLPLYVLIISIETYNGKGIKMANEVFEFNPVNGYKKELIVQELVGKEYETEHIGDGMYVVTVYGLSSEEVEQLRAFEIENL